MPLDEPLLGLSFLEGSYEGGKMTCSFTRDQITQIPIPYTNEEVVTIDLSSELFLLAAVGPMDEDSSDPLQIGYHEEKFGSEEALYLDSYESSDDTEYYEGCGTSKGCVGNLDGCVDSQDCTYLLTYTAVEDENKYAFTLVVVVDSDDEYAAVGWSLNGGSGSMEDDSVVACYPGEDIEEDMEDFVHMYWNVYHGSFPLEDERLGITSASGAKQDSYITCDFVRDAVTTIPDPEDDSLHTIDLNNTPYFVHFARGPLDNNTGLIDYHNERVTGEKLIDFTSYDNTPDNGGTDDPLYDGCGETKGCVGWRNDTQECLSTSNCDYLVTYQGLSEDTYQFELRGLVVGESGNYVATGISTDISMGQDSVTACGVIDGEPRVELYWNNGKGRRTSFRLEDQSGVSDYDVLLEDGVLTCTFSREAVFSVEEDDEVYNFDLNRIPYYLLVAAGDYDIELDPPLLNYHGRDNHYVSPDSQLFSDYNDNVDQGESGFYDGCDSDKGCIGQPEGCISSRDCMLAMSYQGISGNEYRYEIIGVMDDPDSWYVAMGLSSDDEMGDDNVVICKNTADPENSIQAYYNEGKSDPIKLDDPNYNITDGSIEIINNLLYCSFTRSASMILEVGGEEVLEQDVNSVAYYILMARGLLTNDEPEQHDGGLENRAPTDTEVSLFAFNPSADDFYQGCNGDEKGCFGFPDGCLDQQECEVAVSYMGNEDGTYDFALRGPLVEYLAVGFSSDSSMGDDSVVVCSFYEEAYRVQSYYNLPGEKYSEPLEDDTLGLSGQSTGSRQNYYECTFTRDAYMEVPVPGTNDIVPYDLDQEEYYILLVYGNLESSTGHILEHADEDASSQPIYIGAYGPLGRA